MTVKEKRNFLENIIIFDIIIDNLTQQENQGLSNCCKTTANYETDGTQNGSHKNTTESKIIKYLESQKLLSEKINSYIDQYVEMKENAIKAISKLDLCYQDYMFLYFVKPKIVEDDEGKKHKKRNTFDDIARITYTDKSNVSRCIDSAIAKLNLQQITTKTNECNKNI